MGGKWRKDGGRGEIVLKASSKDREGREWEGGGIF
jgi:hypothetical protein